MQYNGKRKEGYFCCHHKRQNEIIPLFDPNYGLTTLGSILKE